MAETVALQAGPDYPEVPPPWALEMVSDESIDPVYVVNENWTRGQARAYMAGALDCHFTEVGVSRLPMVWDPLSAARDYRESRCECDVKTEEECSCPWPGLTDFWDESGSYCPWQPVEDGTPGAVVFWHGEYRGAR